MQSLAIWKAPLAAIALWIVALAVRCYRLDAPTSVVYVHTLVCTTLWLRGRSFDEVHFGGFASKYLQGRYYFDVHPPLGKLLIAWAGQLFGYEGHFSFNDIGLEYPENVPYVEMRYVRVPDTAQPCSQL